MRRALVAVVGVTAGLAMAASAGAGEPRLVAAAGRAYVTAEAGDSAWTIGNEALAVRVGQEAGGTFGIRAVGRAASPVGWAAGDTADLSFVSVLKRLSPGQSGLAFREARASEVDGGVRLSVVFENVDSRVRVTRNYSCIPGAPGIETWSTFESIATTWPVSISDIGVWQVSIPAEDVHWITGLKAIAREGGQFTRRRQVLSGNTRFELGSSGRSSENAVPVVWLTGAAGHFFTGLMWSGAWGLTIGAPDAGGRVTLRWTLGGSSTYLRAGEPFEGPHAFFGAAGAEDSDVTSAMRTFVQVDVRRGRPIVPLVTQNTWFAYGTNIDESSMRAEMRSAAALGVELFVLDAGWYAGSRSSSDFSSGLGVWAADPARFPSGLPALAAYARSLGLKFGLWVEPERVDTRNVGRDGLVAERALAMKGARYDPGTANAKASSAQICLGDAEGRQWVLDALVRLIDQVHPDYLKWDNNFWINCDRSGHGHGSGAGNIAHVNGLYLVLAELRARYPELLIENCSGGGNRLDFGMLRYTDAGWMDDVTTPSAHVRHNLEGLGTVFPSGYLLSFVMNDDAEPLHDAPDLNLYFTSRMPGALGICLVGAEYSAHEIEDMSRLIGLYKRIRESAPDSILINLGSQAPPAGSTGWDALQLFSSGNGDSVIAAFAGGTAPDSTAIKPRALQPEARYTIRDPRGRPLGQATGAELMELGIDVAKREYSAARVLLLSLQ